MTEMLDVWPHLSITIEQHDLYYDNINLSLQGLHMANVAALLSSEHFHRISQISLFISSWLWQGLPAVMQRPLPELTELRISLNDYKAPPLPVSFLGRSAPRLRRLSLERVPFPGIQRLLLSANNLVGQ